MLMVSVIITRGIHLFLVNFIATDVLTLSAVLMLMCVVMCLVFPYILASKSITVVSLTP